MVARAAGDTCTGTHSRYRGTVTGRNYYGIPDLLLITFHVTGFLIGSLARIDINCFLGPPGEWCQGGVTSQLLAGTTGMGRTLVAHTPCMRFVVATQE